MDNQQPSVTLTYEIILLKRVDMMMNSAADGDTDKYYTNFRFAMQIVMSYLNVQTRTALQKDYDALLTEFEKIKQQKDLNEESKRARVRELKQEFADAHSVYIFACFSKVGIQKLKEEGVLDFSVLDIDQMSEIVRGRGLEKTINKVMGVTPNASVDG